MLANITSLFSCRLSLLFFTRLPIGYNCFNPNMLLTKKRARLTKFQLVGKYEMPAVSRLKSMCRKTSALCKRTMAVPENPTRVTTISQQLV